MRRNHLGQSQVTVTELSLGTAALGNLHSPVTDEQAAAALDAAWDSGIRYFDTAPHYGLGLAERRLGEALRGRQRAEFVVSTKVGRLLEPVERAHAGVGDDLAHGFAVPATHRRVWDFSADGVRRSVEDSLCRLGLDRIDVAYLHDPDNHEEQALREAFPALARMRAEGMVGAIGAGMNQAGMLTRFVRDTDLDAVLCAGRYTLLDQRALDERLLSEAERLGKSVVIGGVFNSGLLADPVAGAFFDYSPASEAVRTRALRLQEATESYGVSLRAAALHFPFGHPAVTSVLVGARSAYEVTDAAEQLAQHVPARLWDHLRAKGLVPGYLSIRHEPGHEHIGER